MSRGQPTYALNVAAQLVGLSPRTIRGYEEAQLIEPARVGGNNQRLYSEQDLQWLRCIRDMIHDEGLTVTAIRRLLDLIPCWEIRHCAPSIALQCAPYQNVPAMARGTRHPTAGVHLPSAAGDGDSTSPVPAGGGLEIKLIYGVEELGAVMHCSRCISAERTARRVALRYPGRVLVGKYSILSDEAAKLGVCLSPTIVVGDMVVSCGKGIGEASLTRAVDTCLADRGAH
jgi:MerR family transcriptional regulator/heat shock protein HspR